MARTLSEKPVDQFERCGKAVLEHHFGNHEHCGNWCRHKDQTQEQQQQSTKHYRCKIRDAKLHSLLQSKIARFVTKDALLEVGHGMDTLMNESLNNSIAWLAPKNKVCSTTLSLRNRVDMAVIINGIGLKQFFVRFCDMVDVKVTTDVLHHLDTISTARDKRIAKSKTPDKKKKRQKNFHDKSLEHTEKAKKERCKREGSVYQPGIGMGAGYAISDADDADDEGNKKKRKRSNKDNTAKQCRHCKEFGHCMRTSLQCTHNPKHPNYVGNQPTVAPAAAPVDGGIDKEVDTAVNQVTRDADECDILDTMGFDDDISCGDDEFFDAVDNEEEMELMMHDCGGDDDNDERASGIV